MCNLTLAALMCVAASPLKRLGLLCCLLEALTSLPGLAGELVSAPSEMASFDTMIPEKPPLQLAPAASGLTSEPSACASAV